MIVPSLMSSLRTTPLRMSGLRTAPSWRSWLAMVPSSMSKPGELATGVGDATQTEGGDHRGGQAGGGDEGDLLGQA